MKQAWAASQVPVLAECACTRRTEKKKEVRECTIVCQALPTTHSLSCLISAGPLVAVCVHIPREAQLPAALRSNQILSAKRRQEVFDELKGA